MLNKEDSLDSDKGYCIGNLVDHARNCFIAKAKKNGTIIFLGRFETAKEAAKAYDKHALETFGPEANSNFPIC